MPKLRSHNESVERRKTELRKLYGGFMSLEDVRRELGCRSRNTAAKAVGSLPAYKVTGQKKYDVSDIASLIEKSRTTAGG